MDICGFTAWSSTRHPDQVFTLLQAVYQEFDRVAKLRGVFKIETIGVGVVGVPEHMANHATIALRFASDCIGRMRRVTRKLEVSLGPDTADLNIRVGIHSGPVTAGVLKGDRARFQLFGDTVNTTARLEAPGKIHVSHETAKYLLDHGKQHWVVERDDRIFAKGKGNLVTFWAKPSHMKGSAINSEGSCSSGWGDAPVDQGLGRLIDWNVSILIPILKAIVARREVLAAGVKWVASRSTKRSEEFFCDATVLDEVKEIIALPEFDVEIAKQENYETVVLSAEVESEVQLLISSIAATYRSNPFHNFEHASHVVMSVVKMLSRIVAPKNIADDQLKSDKEIAATLHDHTYGITSDPLTQFACAFSAIIHDADHTCVANPLLAVENPEMASKYLGRSIAEQHSFDITWTLLMDNRFRSLRRAQR